MGDFPHTFEILCRGGFELGQPLFERSQVAWHPRSVLILDLGDESLLDKVTKLGIGVPKVFFGCAIN